MIKKKFPSKNYQSSGLYYDDYIDLKNILLKNVDKKKLKEIIELVIKTIKKKNQIFSCGNGGSSSTAEHLICDFTKGTANNTDLNIRSFSLNSNTSLMTAVANDIIFLFSVSGSSKNIIKSANVAKSKKIKIISFTGFNGGKIKKLSNHNLNFSSNNYGLVEDCHLTIMHYISQFIRMSYLKKNMNLSNINF